MYGLYLEAVNDYINESYGEDVWRLIEARAEIYRISSLSAIRCTKYFRFSFPKVQPPSFCVEEECETSLTLHYRSTRKGFTQFVKGRQLSQVGRQFYNTDIEVEILSKEETEKMTYVIYKMNFDKRCLQAPHAPAEDGPGVREVPMKRGIFFDMFPFSVIFRRDMTMYRIGDGLKEVFSDLQGKKVDEEFTLVRPMLEFSWDNVSIGGEKRGG
ncbi:hypothetical protein J4Q44_G00019670 [Coregonus suidteri]|uniref:guanylate cyclase n=1 Tax=Coregonus suidteri TaxID=861788 RepID=A0AAN8MG26_9TELE